MNTLLVLSLKEKKINYFSLCYHQGTHGFPQKISANLVQPFGLTRSRHEVCAQAKEGVQNQNPGPRESGEIEVSVYICKRRALL